MADFDPDQNHVNIERMAVSQDLREEYDPPGGNRLTRNTSHPIAIIVTIFLTVFPIIFSLVSLFVEDAVPLLLT